MTDASRSLGGTRVVVIGGGSGIGFAVAEPACGAGAEVVIASHRAAIVDAAVERLPGATGRIVDLRDEAGIAGFLEDVGAFDHLAITAGDWARRLRGAYPGRPGGGTPAKAYVCLMLNRYATGQILPVDCGGLLG